jgi:hypothetical protein
MLHLLLDWEYPHWMMMAGAILVSGSHSSKTGTLSRRIMSRRK